MPLTLMYITNAPEVALIAEKNGVDRIWVDLETLGKEERQKNMNTVKSKHTISDVEKMSRILTTSELMVRVNPWNETSKEEIEKVIAAGADIIMLPMWKTKEEVQNFLDAVCNRVKTTLLLETKEAEACLDSVLELSGIDEIHIGLNDLHLSYGLNFMFELLANGTVERICKKISNKGLKYGFGGIATLGNGAVPAEKIILEHYRLGSTRAILSRSFCDTSVITDIKEIEKVFSDNMKEIRQFELYAQKASEELLASNKNDVIVATQAVVRNMKK